MSVTIGELLVNLRASTASFAKDLDKAQQLSFNTSREIERSFKILGAATAGAFTATATAIAALVDHSITAAAEMNRLSQSTGLSVEQFSGLAYAAKLSEVGTGQLSKGLVILSKNLEKSNLQTLEGKAAHSALATLFRGNIPVFKSTDEAFLAIADRLSRLPDGFQKTALAAQIFGKGGAALLPVLNEGAKGLEAIRKEAAQLGVVFDKETAESAEKFEKDVIKLKAAVEGLGNEITKKALPALTQLSQAAVGFAKSDSKGREFFETITHLANGIGGAGGLALQMSKLSQQGEVAARVLKLDTDNAAATAAAVAAAAVAHEKMRQAVASVVDKLREQIATVGQTKFQVEQYIRAIEGWSVADLAHVRVLHTKVEGLIQIQKPLASIIKLTDQQIAQIGQQIEITKQLAAQEDARATAKIGELLQEGSAIDQVLAKGIEESQTLGGALQVPLKPLRDLTEEADRFGQRLGRSLSDAIIHGSGFGQLLKSIIQQFEEMIIKLTIIDPLIDALSSGGHAAGSGGFLGLFSSLLTGFRAEGGPVSAGGAYVVGEKGPEMFYPAVAGNIVPNGGSAGGKVQIIYQIDARGSSITQEQFVRSMKEVEEKAVVRAIHTQRELALRSA